MKFNTLNKILLLPTVAALLVAALAAAGLTVGVLSDKMRQRELERAEAVGRFTAGVAVPYVTNFDLTALANLVKQLGTDKELAYAEILEASGKSLTAGVMKAPDSMAGLVSIEQKITEGSGATIGTVRLAYRMESVVAARNATALVVGLSMAAVAALVAAVLAWVARRVVRQLGGEPAYAAEVATKVASGNLTVKIDTRANDRSSVLYAMKTMVETLSRTVHDIKEATDAISTGSEQIAGGNEDLSQRTEQQATSLEQTASSMEELTSTVLQNAENAKQANQLAAGASDVAVKGGKVIGQVVETMSGINDSSKKITDIISVIDGIAFQTNILALNAAVEAARAGEQGRGFAVVAAEVRTLAQRSAAAAKEIKQLIGDSVHKVEDGTKLVDEAGKTMEQIVTSVKRVSDIMSEIAAASQEQRSGIEEVNQAITQMDHVTQQNAALVEQASAAAESLKQQAQQLVRAVAVFRLAEDAEPKAVPVRDDRPGASGARAMAAPAPAGPVRGRLTRVAIRPVTIDKLGAPI
jgi:methyl-accepting chemotaxis protein